MIDLPSRGRKVKESRKYRRREWIPKGGSDHNIVDLGTKDVKLEQKAYPDQEDTASRQAIEAFVHALNSKLALEVQKLGHRAVGNVIATARRIEWLQKDNHSPNMDNAVRKELKETAAAMSNKVVQVAQPVVAPPASVAVVADSRSVAPFSEMRAPPPPPYVGTGASCVSRRPMLSHIRAKMFHFMQHARWNNALPVRCPLLEEVQTALLQGVQETAESVHFVPVANPWPHHIVCFEPSLELPLCLSPLLLWLVGPQCGSLSTVYDPNLWLYMQGIV